MRRRLGVASRAELHTVIRLGDTVTFISFVGGRDLGMTIAKQKKEIDSYFQGTG
jgi:hypothetical protein